MEVWVTPTPMPAPVLGTPAFDLTGMDYNLAQNAISGWQWLQQQGQLDLLMSIAILLIVILGLLSIAVHLRSVTEGD